MILDVDQNGFSSFEFPVVNQGKLDDQRSTEMQVLEEFLDEPVWHLSEKKDLDRIIAWIIDRYLSHEYTKKIRQRKWGPSIDLWERERDFWQILRRQRYALGPVGIKGELIAKACDEKAPGLFPEGKDVLTSWLIGAGELLPEGAVEFYKPGPLYLFYATERYLYTLLAVRSAGHMHEVQVNIYKKRQSDIYGGSKWGGKGQCERVMNPERHAMLLKALGPFGERLLSEFDVAYWENLLGCTANQVTDFKAECDRLMIARDGIHLPTSRLAQLVLVANGLLSALVGFLFSLAVVTLLQIPYGEAMIAIVTLLSLLVGMESLGKDRGDDLILYDRWVWRWVVRFGMLGRRIEKRSVRSLVNAEEDDKKPVWQENRFTPEYIRGLAHFIKLCRDKLEQDKPLQKNEEDWLDIFWNPFKGPTIPPQLSAK